MTAHDDLAAWERPAAPGGFTLEESARRIGHYAWAEMRTFEILGAWTQDFDHAAVAASVATHANQHAWHAELWHQRYPELREWDRDSAVRPASDDLVAFFDAVAAATSTIERLVAAYRVLLPHLVATYSFHGNRSSPTADGPVLRTLGFVLADDTSQMADGALMLASLLGPGDVASAAAVQGDLEARLVASGGIAGQGTVPRSG